jgi:type I restriction enzyme R subunit
MKESQIAVVVSEEQGEVAKFRKEGFDIRLHRRLIKDGMELPESMRQKPQFQNRQRMALDDAFKTEEHPFRVAIVCAMWMTGFDVPSLAILYLDKPLKAHTLMQAIARANRVNEGKNNGLIVDYCGILRNLRKALATYAGQADTSRGRSIELDPTRPEEELLGELGEAISLVKRLLEDHGASLADIIERSGFSRNAAIMAAKEAANENDETRKRFEVMCREVFRKFKACINIQGVNAYRGDRDAVNIVYKSLQKDRDAADISDIIRQLQGIVDEAIELQGTKAPDDGKIYDISKIDFERLRQEFEHSPAKNTATQNLRQIVENRVRRLLEQNPLRTDFQRHYEQVVADYNREKDRVTIEQTFQALLSFIEALDEEEERAVREGLDEESLAIFDLLRKAELSPAQVKKIKSVAVDLLGTLKAEKLRVHLWRDKETTRDSVRQTIRDFLWSDATGLPVGTYSEADVQERAETVFRHVYRAYPTVPSPFYAGGERPGRN